VGSGDHAGFVEQKKGIRVLVHVFEKGAGHFTSLVQTFPQRGLIDRKPRKENFQKARNFDLGRAAGNIKEYRHPSSVNHERPETPFKLCVEVEASCVGRFLHHYPEHRRVQRQQNPEVQGH